MAVVGMMFRRDCSFSGLRNSPSRNGLQARRLALCVMPAVGFPIGI